MCNEVLMALDAIMGVPVPQQAAADQNRPGSPYKWMRCVLQLEGRRLILQTAAGRNRVSAMREHQCNGMFPDNSIVRARLKRTGLPQLNW